MFYKIGVDVGGTNTDAVLVSNADEIIAKTKQTTTSDISSGIENAISEVLSQSKIPKELIKYIMLGTTHCTNALVERKELNKVGAIRIGLPAGSAIPIMTDFPEDLKKMLEKHCYMVNGGYEYDGRLLNPLNEMQIKACLLKMKGEVESLAITGIFSKINADQEIQVKDWAKEILGDDIKVSCSFQIGGLGLLDRENACILNAALHGVALKMVHAFRATVSRLQLNAQLFIGQNDGTLMSLEQVQQFPIHTISSGPTNSIRGAGLMSKVKNGIVIDVGGTTSDAGALINFFPRESTQATEIGGVLTNFRMPDVVSVGIGGGTIVRFDHDVCTLGPDSVGFRLKEKSIAFGGDTLTLSDFFIADNQLQLNDVLQKRELVAKISSTLLISYEQALELVKTEIQQKIEKLVDALKNNADEVSVVGCGGGAFLLPKKIAGVSEVLFPRDMEVANAFGVCIAKISSEEEIVINTMCADEKEEMQKLLDKAKSNLLSKGAKQETIAVLIKEAVPLAYLPGAMLLRIKLFGDLNN
ncbi:hydantoinase/oxoprolinase N-terminal domain-containing protein [Pedobacter xixiisoli]|uniref:N-methylhydantoinase A/oxoprolinase/acetone carboxylase, beta subunit n=1 Tax=Pedobacter xixiisoli TaxID=1476464 RepID=A0A285ZSW7_9SPHI|nr:hydantoinase/oxoprolinase family protein [Pedobacter xixiisoli]SOD12742.1 N-methylhydantoinase A/oxoprolinase/acetone carboxylase, beta subunit [Pedobacter xixiisoli]